MLVTEVTSTQLNEYFAIPYDMFGWIAPGGKVMLATPKQSASSHVYYHKEVAKELGFSGYVAAWKAGYVRWFCEGGELVMETNQPISEQLIATVTKGAKTIEKLAQNPDKFRHFDGTRSAFHIMDYCMDAKGFYESRESVAALVAVMKRRLEKQ